MFNIGLFVFRQLGWVIDLHLVARYLRFVLVGISLAFRTLTFNDLIAWDRVLRAIWVGDRYITVVTDRDLATFWQRRLAILILVGAFDGFNYFRLFVFRQLGWVIDLDLVSRQLWLIRFRISPLHFHRDANLFTGLIRISDYYRRT